MEAAIKNPPEQAAGEDLHRNNNDRSANYTSSTSPVETLLNHLDGVRHIGGSKWLARCPAHEDRTPSLSIRETEEGTVLLNDFGGCSPGEVLSALGLEFMDLYPGPLAHHVKGRKRPRQKPSDVLAAVSHALTVVSLADSKLAQGEPLNSDERESVGKALRVLAKFQREGRRWH